MTLSKEELMRVVAQVQSLGDNGTQEELGLELLKLYERGLRDGMAAQKAAWKKKQQNAEKVEVQSEQV
jgi:hypothetical protein